jgi:hypothetical protein
VEGADEDAAKADVFRKQAARLMPNAQGGKNDRQRS